jgi:hypothetical protein
MSYITAVLALFFLAWPVYARAQNEGFASAGPILIGESPQFSASFGAEQISERGLSGGVDGIMVFGRTGPRSGAPGGERYHQLVLSGLVGAHSRRPRGIAPFFSGGLSFVTDPDCCGPGLGWTVGGGARFWVTEHVGIRTDARLALPFGGEGGMLVGRIGMVIRRRPASAAGAP